MHIYSIHTHNNCNQYNTGNQNRQQNQAFGAIASKEFEGLIKESLYSDYIFKMNKRGIKEELSAIKKAINEFMTQLGQTGDSKTVLSIEDGNPASQALKSLIISNQSLNFQVKTPLNVKNLHEDEFYKQVLELKDSILAQLVETEPTMIRENIKYILKEDCTNSELRRLDWVVKNSMGQSENKETDKAISIISGLIF